MVKIVLLFAILGVLAGVYFWSTSSEKSILSPSSFRSNSNETLTLESNFVDLGIGEKKIRVAYIKTSPQNISLISNLKDKKIGKEILSENNCTSLVSAGFYNKSNNHIGLFVSEGETVSGYEQNRLFNGVFVVNEEAKIFKRMPDRGFTTALQSGPVLYYEGLKQQLVIAGDEEERRIVVLTTESGEVLYAAFYNKNSVFIGPKLADMPTLVEKFGKETGEEIKSALNLDGGTASVFYSGDIILGELQPVGGYFCVK